MNATKLNEKAEFVTEDGEDRIIEDTDGKFWWQTRGTADAFGPFDTLQAACADGEIKMIAQPEGTKIETLSERFERCGYPDFLLCADSWAEIDRDDYTTRFTDGTTEPTDGTLYVFADRSPGDGEPDIDKDLYPKRLVATPLANGYRDELNQLVFAM